jgi:RHS repeat-associated protein
VDGANNTYTYDADGLRVNKNGLVYIYSGSQPIATYASGAAANSPGVEYIYAGSKRVGSFVGSAFTYNYADHLSTRVQTDSSGTVTRAFGNFPFGETWYETGTVSKWKFTTYERDSESGLDYAQARFDATQFGRFMSLDPLPGNIGNPQSLNRYSYVMNDPINLTDPSGAVPGCITSPIGCVPNGGGNNWTCLLDNFGNCTGGGGPSDGGFVDGQWIPFGIGNLLQGGLGEQCPDNFCEGNTLNNGYVKFVAYADGTSGYMQVLAGPDPQLYDRDYIIESQRQVVVQKITERLCAPGDAECEAYVDSQIQPEESIGDRCVVGGNCNFSLGELNIDISGCINGRCDVMPSLHFDYPGTVHLDTANPFSLWGFGALAHFVVDVVLGNTIFSGGIPR